MYGMNNIKSKTFTYKKNGKALGKIRNVTQKLSRFDNILQNISLKRVRKIAKSYY
jgi:hypothetical protein